MNESLKTPLYDKHIALGARMAPFAGWLMPIQYSSILEEAQNVRKNAGLFDVSHMGQIRVTGRDASEFLRFLLPNDVSRIKAGKAMYSPVCYPDGGVIDDVIVYRLGEQEFLVVVNAGNATRDFDWMLEQRRELDVEITNESDQWGLLSIQGPKAEKIVSKLFPKEAKKLSYFGFESTHVLGSPGIIARTGYTGEDGFEIYCASEKLCELWDHIMGEGQKFGLLPTGLGARDILRLEMGYALYGHELNAQHSPLSSGLAWTLRMGDRDFIGKDALEDELVGGSPDSLIFFNCNDRRIPRESTSIYIDGNPVGKVVSGVFSPNLNTAIGSGFIRWNTKRKGPVPGTIHLKIRDSLLPATVCRPPFLESTSLKVKKS